MKKKLFALAALVAALGSTAGTASAQDVLTGDTRLACEAILCLSSGTRPSECTPSLSRYFNITKRKLSDTIRARLNFLQLCPVASQTPEMQSLVSAISRGAGRCDAQSLNSTVVMWPGRHFRKLLAVLYAPWVSHQMRLRSLSLRLLERSACEFAA